MQVPLAVALTALQSEIEGLLTAPADPTLAPEVRISALRSHAAGIGGFVGLNTEPRGEIFARRLDARVIVRVKAASPAALAAAEAEATNALLGADAIGLRRRGVFRITRDIDGVEPVLAAADGLAAPAGKDLRFSVLYEHVQPPDAPAGAIDELPQDVFVGALSRTARVAYDSAFETDPMADFDTIDDPDATGAGAWSYDAATWEIRQTGDATGGSNNVNGSKIGTYLVLRPARLGAPVRDFVLFAEMRTDTGGGMGLVFRFADVDNFGFFLMNRPAPYRLFGRQAGGDTSLLDAGGVSQDAGYQPGEWVRLRLHVQDDRFELALDERAALEGRDQALGAPGSVGFMCRNNATARFRRLRLLAL